MEVRPGYKFTEVGAIPDDWNARQIGDDIDLLTGHPFPSTGYSESGVRLLRGSNVKRGETDWNDDITQYWPAVTSDIARYQLEKGDLVIAMDGSLVGRSFAQLTPDDLPALLLQRVARIRSETLDVTYLTAFVGSDRFVKYADSVKTVTAIPHISPGDIRKFTIPVPPTLPEQRAIASTLSDMGALLGGLDQLIAKKRDLKHAAMQQLLTGQIRLPGFHGEWEVKRLGDVADVVMGQSPSSSNYNTQGHGLPLIQGNADISQRQTSRRVFTTQVTKRGTAGDILLSVRAPVGEVSRATFDVCLGRGVCAVRFPNDFLYHYLILLEPRWARHSKGSTFDSVNSADVNALEICLPAAHDEQSAIAAVLSDMDAELTALAARLDKTRALKQGMMQELLTGRTRLV